MAERKIEVIEVPIYQDGTCRTYVASPATGFTSKTLKESELLRCLASAIAVRENLDVAIHNMRQLLTLPAHVCNYCGSSYDPMHDDQWFCTSACAADWYENDAKPKEKSE